MEWTNKQRLLHQAAELVGRSDLAKGLGVSEEDLDAWMRGEGAMPDGKLRPLADFLDKVAASRRQ
ncbi:MAG TPA: hypothetical protein VFB93_18860 [Burkholderiales bacterium]|nr:hypothetical protein [Burkholderiales bacterium]